MKTFIYMLVFMLSLSACKGKKPIAEASKSNKGGEAVVNEVEKDSLFASFEKTACFGFCPTYILYIYKSGFAVLDGQKNIDHIGQYSAQLPKDDLNAILKKAEDIDFFLMDDAYDGNVSDLPTTITVINKDGRKQVRNRFKGPESLKSLESMLHHIVEQSDWKVLEKISDQ